MWIFGGYVYTGQASIYPYIQVKSVDYVSLDVKFRTHMNPEKKQKR